MASAPTVAGDPIGQIREAGGRVMVAEIEGWLSGTGGRDRVLEANRLALGRLARTPLPASASATRVEGPVAVHPSARVERSLLRGPIVIGEDAVVTDSYVGPYTSVGARSVLEGVEVEHSILMPGARLQFVGQRVQSSIIGAGARVHRTFAVPGGLRLTVGDGAEVAIS
jgi:glucose-1-phosphate thymidylyltransferase